MVAAYVICPLSYSQMGPLVELLSRLECTVCAHRSEDRFRTRTGLMSSGGEAAQADNLNSPLTCKGGGLESADFDLYTVARDFAIPLREICHVSLLRPEDKR